MKHNYLALWKEYKKILKQRNALLKQQAPYTHFIPWDMQLCDIAYQLDELRQNYFNEWIREFALVLRELTDHSCSIQYYKGWDKKKSGRRLEDILIDSFTSDKHSLYTHYGAHQADILIESDTHKAKHILSRGQQKIVLIALKLAQSNLLTSDCLYLFDDLAAELDDTHQKKLLYYLSQRPGQYVLTSLNELNFENYLSSEEVNIFSSQSF